MRKHYWKEDKGFGNAYILYHTDNKSDETLAEREGLERIGSEEAIRLCVEENKRRKENPSFAGYAPTYIIPLRWRSLLPESLNAKHERIQNTPHHGYVIED